MPSGGTLTFSTERRVDRRDHTASIEIRVRDTGIGMDEATVDQLYVPFFTTKTHGTGLGLAISQRLVLAHGGDIEVLTAPLRGTTFVIRIPLPPAEGR